MTSGATEKCSTQPATVAAQYETLRTAALGAALAPEARSGLMLFLRRGMWGWARTLCAASARQEPLRAPSSSPIVLGEQRTVIHVFAAMAVNTNGRRAP
jgi:hypothetical protein